MQILNNRTKMFSLLMQPNRREIFMVQRYLSVVVYTGCIKKVDPLK